MDTSIILDNTAILLLIDIRFMSYDIKKPSKLQKHCISL